MYKQLVYQLLRFILVIGGAIGAYYLLKYMTLFLYPFIFAIILSLIINPAVTFFERKLKFPRVFATLTIISSLFIFIISLIFFIITEVIQGTTYLAEKVPVHFQIFIAFMEKTLQTKIVPYYEKLTSLFHTLNQSQQTTINEHIHQFTTQIASSGSTLLQHILLKIPAIFSLLPQSITILILTIIATFLITNDMDNLKILTRKVISVSATTTSKKIWLHLKEALFGFVKAQVMLITITACLIFIGLLLLQIEHALTIALLAALVDLLPYIGTGIIFIPWILYLFLTANYVLTINLTILYIIIIILRQIIEPKILAANIGINPLATLITLFIGIKLWGIFGIIIAPILLVFASALYKAGIAKQLWKFVKG